MKKTFKVILLPTEKAQPNQLIYQQIKNVYGETVREPVLEFTTNETYIRNSVLMNSGKAATNSQSMDQYFELHIISDDDINFCDWYYNPVLKKVQKKYSKEQDYIKRDNCKKIIASTDKSITLNSCIQESFIKAYVKAFNEKHPISEVDLEIKDVYVNGLDGYPSIDLIKTREDGSVIIRQSKTYSRLEVEALLNSYQEYAWKNGVTIMDLNKWIETNVK